MALMVANRVTNRQIFEMTVATLTERLNMLKRGIAGQHMLAANPARHLPMQLARHGLVNLVAGMAQLTHSNNS